MKTRDCLGGIMCKIKFIKIQILYLSLIGLFFQASPSFSGEVLQELPNSIDTNGKYIFFLHGRIVQEQGVAFAESKKYGFYEYEKILKVLAGHGFTVVSEARSDPKIKGYAKKISSQVGTLTKKGVPPSNITVAGFSDGGKITLIASSLIGNEHVNYIVLAGCSRSSKKLNKFIGKNNLDLKGRVLSIVDRNDENFFSCEKAFNSSSGGLEHKELILKDGSGHGLFYTPKDKWITPLIDWVK
jgi:hypothetical protein